MFLNMYFTYVLQSLKDNRIYVGLTEDVERRLKQHNAGYNRSTKAYLPWKLLLVEEFELRTEARAKEIYYKSGVGKEHLKLHYS
jgi:putative endonuclease